MKKSRSAAAAVALLAIAAASFVVSSPAQAATTVQLTKTLTGSGSWTIPSGATNIVVAMSSAAGAAGGGTAGVGGKATYALAGSAAGSVLSYSVGSVGDGSPTRPDGRTSGRGGSGTAIAVAGTLLAVAGGGGGGGGGAGFAATAGGVGGVATTSGVTAGGSGQSISGSTAAGEGGQTTRGGLTSTTAEYATGGSGVYKGASGENGPAAVSGGVISLALGGYAASTGGGGGSGYTGGAGGTMDLVGETFDPGSGGGGSGYLAASGISFVTGSAGSSAGAGSLVVSYDAPQLVTAATATVGGKVGQSFSWNPITVTAGSSPYAYALASGSSLPAGLALSATTGQISGTPTTTGTTSFTVTVTDATAQTSSQPLQITVGTLTVSGPTLAAVGGTLELSGSGYDAGSYDVVIAGITPSIGTATADGSGALTFSGTVPTTATPGVHAIGVFRSGILVASVNVTLVATLVATPTTAPNAFRGQAFSWTPLDVTGGAAPLSYSLTGTLPAGTSLNASTGTISGTPSATGTTSFTVTVTDDTPQTSSQSLQITVGTLTVSGPTRAAIGGPLTLTGSGYDAGSYEVRIDGATPSIGTAAADGSGALTFSGTVPTTATPGSHAIGVFRSGIQVATTNVALVATLVATPTTAPAAFRGQDFSWTPLDVTGGDAPFSYSLTGTLPAGLTLNASTGIVSGVPTGATTAPAAFSVTVTDSTPTPQSQSVPLTLAVGTLTISAPGSAAAGTAITVTGSGFDLGDYSVELHSSPVVLGTAHVDASGGLNFTATIPTSVDPGSHQLQILRGGVLVASSTITVTAVGTKIASTGLDAGPAGVLALVLILLGAGVWFTRRVRYSSSR